MTLSDLQPRFKGHGVTIDALNVLYALLTRDLFAIAKFLALSPAVCGPPTDLNGVGSKGQRAIAPSIGR